MHAHTCLTHVPTPFLELAQDWSHFSAFLCTVVFPSALFFSLHSADLALYLREVDSEPNWSVWLHQ